jgi:hypothetical protein
VAVAEVVCHQYVPAAAAGLGLAVVLLDPLLGTTVDQAVLKTVVPAVPGRVAPISVARVVRVTIVVRVTTVVLVVRVMTVVLVVQTSAAPVILVVLVTSAGLAVLVVLVTSVVLVVPTTSDRGLRTRSADGEVPRGVMERRRGAGEHRHEPDGAAPFRLRVASGTKGRSTTGATTRPRYGIRARTAGASTSSESGSRCKQTPVQ